MLHIIDFLSPTTSMWVNTWNKLYKKLYLQKII